MSDQPNSRSLISRPAAYRIRIPGRLDAEWSERLQGMKVSFIEQEGYGTITELNGQLPDQTALMGVLELLYNCGIPLISMECTLLRISTRPPTES